MEPIKTPAANVLYQGDGDTVRDVWAERVEPGMIALTYELDDHDRAVIAAGGQVRQLILTEPIPPTAVAVVPASPRVE